MQIRPVGVAFFHAGGKTEGRTDTTKLVLVFALPDFENAPTNEMHILEEMF
jgi:hypothetical protein